MDTWTVTRARTEQHHLPGMYLGRNYYRDSRDLAYPWQRKDRELTSQLWLRHIPVLDQGNVGSCTGNEEVGALGCDPVFGALPPSPPLLDENLALKLYSAAETIDGDGPYPPNDSGSSGPSAAKAALQLGLISGYLHCLTLADVLDALEEHPVGIGCNWYTGFDNPDASGFVSIGAGDTVRGGHEFICRGKDVSAQVVHCDNSWGTAWGLNGSFTFSWADLDRLLKEQGDGTVSLPLTVTPPAPVPVPTPAPAPPHVDAADQTLYDQTQHWANERHIGTNEITARDLIAWYQAKGLQQ